MRVLIAGGGTGGHVYPALAIIEELSKWNPGISFAYVGTARGLETRVLPSYPGVRFFPIHVRGLDRTSRLRMLGSLFLLAISFFETLVLLARFRPHMVIGVGGYASFPAVSLAALLGRVLPIRTMIHEQNAVAGLVNRILGRFVDKVLLSYPQSRRDFSKAKSVVVTGNPVRDEFLAARRTPAAYRSFGLTPGVRTVLIFGGSLGSEQLVDEVIRAKESIARTHDVQVLLVTGRAADDERIRRELRDAGATNVQVVSYIERMGEAFALADLVVSRAGATTLAEITSCGKASILVPWSGAADDHQRANARVLESERACTVADEEAIVRRGLVTIIRETIRDDRALAQLAENSRRLGMRQARTLILGEIRATMRGARA